MYARIQGKGERGKGAATVARADRHFPVPCSLFLIPIRQFALIALPAGLVLAGCMAVDPRPDYRTTADQISETTGYPDVYSPAEDELVQSRVESLLSDGLTADEAAQICLLNNPDLQAMFFGIGMARADVAQAGLFSNPTLGVSLRLPSGGGLANLGASVAQNIADLWQIPSRKQAADRHLDRAILEVAAGVSDLVGRTKAEYFKALAANEAVALATGNQHIAQQLLDAAVIRQEAGAGNRLEVNLARSELTGVEIAAQTARREAYATKAALAMLLGLTLAPDDFELIDALPDPPSWQLAEERLQELATQHRLDLKAAQQSVQAAQAEWTLQRRSVFRSLEVGVTLERGERTPQTDLDFVSDTVFNSISSGMLTPPRLTRRKSKHTDFIIGPSIDLEIPIFDQNQAQIAKAEYKYQQALKTLDGLLRRVEQESRVASNRATTSWDIVRSYRDRLLPQRQDNLNLSRDAYRLGKTTFLSVLEAQRDYLSAQSEYVERLVEGALSLVALEQVTGQPLSKILEGALERDVTDDGESQP